MDKISTLIAAGIVGLTSQSANAIIIDFDYSYDGGFFSGANESRRDILNAAGSFFETRLSDNLNAIRSTGNDHFNANFDRPDTGIETTLFDYSVDTDTLVVFVGGQNLSESTLGHGGPGGYSASSSSSSFFDNLDTRGQGPDTSDFGPWGGVISFNSASTSSWFFDLALSNIGSNQNDFYSVAIHELGHVLGYGTSTTWNTLHNGSHWTEGTMSLVDGISQEAAMDPTIKQGTRKYFTDLDLQGLTDIGWQVTSVPVPATVYLLGSAMLGLLGFRRKL